MKRSVDENRNKRRKCSEKDVNEMPKKDDYKTWLKKTTKKKR